jgi:hypothetical protein
MGLATPRVRLWEANAKFPIGFCREKVINKVEELLAYYRDDSNAVQYGNAESSTWTTERRHFSVA